MSLLSSDEVRSTNALLNHCEVLEISAIQNELLELAKTIRRRLAAIYDIDGGLSEESFEEFASVFGYYLH